MSVQYLVGDCREVMRSMPEQSVHCVVTSPPYWGLRDYKIPPSDWDGGKWRGVLGNEPSPYMFVDHCVEVFTEAYRVLRDDGTLWLNIGDTYNNSGGDREGSNDRLTNRHRTPARKNATELKQKELIGVPWMLAFALRAAGWYLRQDIIWHKPAPMPGSMRDRCVTAHEYIFLFSKRPRYYFDHIAIQEPAKGREPGNVHGVNGRPVADKKTATRDETLVKANERFRNATPDAVLDRNKRSVWTVANDGYGGEHFAAYPKKLILPCILAATSEHGYCSCGAPYRRLVKTTKVATRPAAKSKIKGVSGLDSSNPHEGERGMIVGNRDPQRHLSVKETIGWEPTCKCSPANLGGRGVVLDPFGGSGTTALAAADVGVDAILIDISDAYSKQQRRRNRQSSLL